MSVRAGTDFRVTFHLFYWKEVFYSKFRSTKNFFSKLLISVRVWKMKNAKTTKYLKICGQNLSLQGGIPVEDLVYNQFMSIPELL